MSATLFRGYKTISSASRLFKKGGLSIFDQLVMAGGNILINVAVARSVSIESYAYFAAVYALIALVSAIHATLVAEPISVFWELYKKQNISFIQNVLAINIIFSLSALLILCLFYLFSNYIENDFSTNNVVSISLILIFLPLFWTLRQIHYAKGEPGKALIQTTVYSVVLIGSVGMLSHLGLLTSVAAIFTIALAGGLASLMGLYRLPIGFWRIDQFRWNVNVVRSCMRHGSWSSLGAAAMWATVNAPAIILPAYRLDVAAGQLRALMNIVLPYQQVLLGISQIAIPTLARLRYLFLFRRLRVMEFLFLALGIIGAITFAALVGIFGGFLYLVMYNGKYAFDTLLILPVTLVIIMLAINSVLRAILRARGRPSTVFIGYGLALVGVAPWVNYVLASGSLEHILFLIALSQFIAATCMLIAYVARSVIHSSPPVIETGMGE